MPHKVYRGVDYDEDYGDYYDDYDYDYDEEINERETSTAGPAVSKSRIWSCPICTYDNDENQPFCDICGVIRDSSVNINNSGADKTVGGMCKDSGVSVMAKSLFSSPLCRTPKTDTTCQQLSCDFLSKGINNSLGIGNFRRNFYDFQKVFTAPRCGHSRDIVPFKFDKPSPDDLVSAGKNSAARASTVNSLQLPQSKVSSSTIEEKRAVKVLSSDKKITETSSASLVKAHQPDKDERSGSVVSEDKPQALASNLHNLNLRAKPGSSKNSMSARRPTSQGEYKPEKWMLSDQHEKNLTQLSLAIVGHVDSGKSTLSGRLLFLLGRISQKEMHKFEKESKQKGKGSFAYAWALDASGEERERGVTMTVAVAHFISKKYHVVVLDSPGHKDFVPNMISGATQADAAVLVVDASMGSFEAGMEGNGGGQTKEHAQLIRSFGVEQIIVAVNKMDVIEYSKERFDHIKVHLCTFLRSCGFKESLVKWIPLSAMENQNLVASASDTRLSSWYQGPTLLDAIDMLQPPARDVSKPLRMPICDVIKSHSLGQVAVSGKLEAGALRNGTKVLVMPSGDLATIKSVEQDSNVRSVARAGDNISISLQGIDGSCLMTGGVLCHPDFPVLVATRLELKVLVLDISMPILVGSQLEFLLYHAKEAAKVVKILSLIDPKTGKVSKKAPRCLLAKQSAIIEMANLVLPTFHCQLLQVSWALFFSALLGSVSQQQSSVSPKGLIPCMPRTTIRRQNPYAGLPVPWMLILPHLLFGSSQMDVDNRMANQAKVALERPVCVEEFSNCKALGRAFLRQLGNTVAVGIIVRVVEEN